MTDLTKRILETLARLILTAAFQLFGNAVKKPPGPDDCRARKTCNDKKQ